MRLSPDQCRKKPASREIRCTGYALVVGPISIGRPVLGNGATKVLKRSSNAIHSPLGDTANSVAFGLRTCSISSRPGSGDALVGTLMLSKANALLRKSRKYSRVPVWSNSAPAPPSRAISGSPPAVGTT